MSERRGGPDDWTRGLIQGFFFGLLFGMGLVRVLGQ